MALHSKTLHIRHNDHTSRRVQADENRANRERIYRLLFIKSVNVMNGYEI